MEENWVHILETEKNIKKITKRCPSVTYETLVVKSTNAFYIFSTSNVSKKATRTFGLIFCDYHFLAESGTFTKKNNNAENSYNVTKEPTLHKIALYDYLKLAKTSFSWKYQN